MWQRLNRLQICSVYKFVNKRTFLSDSYKCNEVWNSRLSTPVLQNINLDAFFIELDQKFVQQGKASAIDIDIYANSVQDDSHIDELADLIHKLRMTEESSNILESTGHALIRSYLENDNIELLINILDDRLSYGVFLDNYTANLLLNNLLKKNEYKLATRIAICQMLQEDFKSPITQSLSLLACYKYLENPEPFEQINETEKEPENVKKEEIKVRVKYIRNEYFDDHFDIKNSIHLVGKTLQMLGKKIGGSIGDSAKLYGLCLYEKYPEAIIFLNTLKAGSKLYSEVLDKSIEILKNVADENKIEDAKKLLTELNTKKSQFVLQNEKFEDDIRKLITNSVEFNEKNDIIEQEKIYASWIEIRQQLLNDELERLKRSERIKEIEKITKDLEVEERKLWFFEKQEEIDLEIENKKVHYPKRWFGKKKKPRVIDEGYVPPEIKKNRN